MKLFDNLFICVNYSALDRANRDELVVLARDFIDNFGGEFFCEINEDRMYLLSSPDMLRCLQEQIIDYNYDEYDGFDTFIYKKYEEFDCECNSRKDPYSNASRKKFISFIKKISKKYSSVIIQGHFACQYDAITWDGYDDGGYTSYDDSVDSFELLHDFDLFCEWNNKLAEEFYAYKEN